MSVKVEQSGKGRAFRWRVAGWGLAAFLLLLPFLAMQVSDEVAWSGGDFVLVALMLGIAGGAVELAARISGNRYFRGGALVAIVACFLLVIVNLAVGFLGDEGNPANLMFAGVIAVAIGGAIVAHFRAAGMARAMVAAAAAQALAAVVGLAAGWASPGYDGIREVILGTGLFGGLFLLSAFLFVKAASEDQA